MLMRTELGLVRQSARDGLRMRVSAGAARIIDMCANPD